MYVTLICNYNTQNGVCISEENEGGLNNEYIHSIKREIESLCAIIRITTFHITHLHVIMIMTGSRSRYEWGVGLGEDDKCPMSYHGSGILHCIKIPTLKEFYVNLILLVPWFLSNV